MVVATIKDDSPAVKPKRGSFIALGGLLPKVSTYRKEKSVKDDETDDQAAVDPTHTNTKSKPEQPQEDQARELPDFHSERRSLNGVTPTPAPAASVASALRRRGLSIEQTATSLYRRMSVRQSSAPEPAADGTESSSSSLSPQSEPEVKIRRGMCVATTFGTGTVLDVRLDDSCYVVQVVPQSIAYLQEDAIVREIKSVVGERVKTRWGMATVEQYYVDEDMYSIALDWRWDDEHVWRMKATTKKFEKIYPKGTLMQNTKNRLFEGYSSLRESVVGSKLLTTTKSFAATMKSDALEQADGLGQARTPFGVCTVLAVRPDKFFVVETPCGATAYLGPDSVRMLGRRTHFANGDRVDTPFGPGLVAHFREDDDTYAVELEASLPAGQSPLLFMSDEQAQTDLTPAPAAANTRLSSILNLTRTSMMNAGERMRSASVAGNLPTLPANLPVLSGNLPTLSSVKAKVSTMTTLKMSPKNKYHKDERVLTTFGSGFVVEARSQDKVYRVHLRRLKISGYFHESRLSPFPYERVTHFVVDGRSVLAPPIPKNASSYKRRAVISAAIKSAREGTYVDPSVAPKVTEVTSKTPVDAMVAADAVVAINTAAAIDASVSMPVPVAE
uniref:Uncharacterized protein n=1 Tax=Peronospora matthiolae TaxID=2874970 RepID=A0AAV1TRP6_9STRA